MPTRFHGGYRGGLDVIDFSVNINPLAPPDFIMENVYKCFESIKYYPDWEYRTLRKRLAELYGIDPELIYPSNGASQGLFTILHYVKPRTIIWIIPSYGDYADFALATGINLIEIPMTDQGRGFYLDWVNVVKVVRNSLKPSVVVIVNPVNPTGTLFSDRDIDDFIAMLPGDTYLLLDEAYMDLSKGEFSSSYSDVDSVFTVKSLTKTLGLPGLRIGLVIGWKEGIEGLWKVTGSWQVNSIVECTLTRIIESYTSKLKGFLKKSKEYIRRERQWLGRELSRIGFQVYPSEANFFLVRHEWINTFDLVQMMLKQQIYLRRGDMFRGLGCKYTRIAVRQRSDNKELVRALEKISKHL